MSGDHNKYCSANMIETQDLTRQMKTRYADDETIAELARKDGEIMRLTAERDRSYEYAKTLEQEVFDAESERDMLVEALEYVASHHDASWHESSKRIANEALAKGKK